MDKPTTLRAGWREMGLVALALAALTAVVLFLSDGVVLFARPLWLDEWLTVIVARRDTPAQVIGDLAAGADGGSGLYHLVVWTADKVAGELTPSLLRAISLAFVGAALCFVYATLRARFQADAAFAGAMAVGASGIVVAHSYDARFYGPWLCFAAAHAWSLSRAQESPTPGRRSIQGAAALLLALVHFYGVVSLCLMLAGVVVAQGRRWRDALRVIAPSLVGFVGTALLVPMAMSMRRAFSVRSWIPDFAMSQLADQAREFWVAGVPLIAVAAIAIACIVDLVRRRSRPSIVAASARAAISDAGIVSLAALALTPIAFAVVSLAGQPAMIARYSIAAALAWGPLMALAVSDAGTRGRMVARGAAVLLLWFWFAAYTREVWAQLLRFEEVRGMRTALDEAARSGLPVASPLLHVVYPLLDQPETKALAFLELSDSIFATEFGPGSPREQGGRFYRADRDLARVHAARYGSPRIVTVAAFDSVPAFLLLAPARPLNPGFRNMEQFVSAVFPGRELTMIRADLGVVRRVSGVTR